MNRLLVVGAAAALLSACAANPKTAHPGDSVIDGASASAAAAPAAAPAPTPDPSLAAQDSDAGSCGMVRVRFAFDSAQLDDPAMRQLRDDAQCLSKRKPVALLIEGHCDERGTTAYNIALGARRADAVRKYLADLGVKTKFETVSFGKELPIAEGSSEGAWSQNRRSELRLPGDKRADGQLFAGNSL